MSASRVLAWSEALAFLKTRRRQLLLSMWAPVLVIVVANMPWIRNSWLSGFLTAFMICTVAWVLIWVTWVSSGLAFRIQGALAEDWSSELFRSLPNVQGVIPSWKYDGGDIDHIVITPRFILAVETKWRSAELTPRDKAWAAQQAERGAQRLRRELRSWNEPLGSVQVLPLVLYWGPKVDHDLDTTVPTDVELVRILGESATQRRVGAITTGPIGEDFADGLLRRLDATARQRDQLRVSAGWVVRRLAKAT